MPFPTIWNRSDVAISVRGQERSEERSGATVEGRDAAPGRKRRVPCACPPAAIRCVIPLARCASIAPRGMPGGLAAGGQQSGSIWSEKALVRISRGFTLIEVLVAFLILAFSLGALFSLFSGSLRSVRQGEDYAQAAALARSQLARIDADGFDGQGIETGETEDGYRWRMEFAPLPASVAPFGDGNFEPLAVTVTVSWGALDNRSMALSTVRLARR